MSETILAHGAHPSVRRDHPRGGRQGQGVAGPRPSEALQAGQDPHAGSSLLRTTPAPHDATTTPSALPASSGGQHLSLPSHRIASQKSTGKNKAGRRKARENHRHHSPPPARTAKRSRQPTNNLRWPGHQSRPVPAEFSRVQFKRAAVGDATDAVPT